MSPTSTSRLLRLSEILGDRHSSPPVPPLIPVSKSTWWKGVSEGIYPAPFRISKRSVAWRAEELQSLIDSFQRIEGRAVTRAFDACASELMLDRSIKDQEIRHLGIK
jgi:prophage regulatory protein